MLKDPKDALICEGGRSSCDCVHPGSPHERMNFRTRGVPHGLSDLATRKLLLLLRFSATSQRRIAERLYCGMSVQEPPRRTRAAQSRLARASPLPGLWVLLTFQQSSV